MSVICSNALGSAADEQFIVDLYTRHGGAVRSYLRRLGSNQQDAEDIVQETMVRAWRNSAVLDPTTGAIRGWLFTVARRIMIDRVRVRSDIPVGMDPAGPQPQVADHQSAVVTRIDVGNALARLSPEHRSAVIEVYYRGRTIDAAARSLGVPLGTVKSRLHYGLRSLRAMYEAGQLSDDPRPYSARSGAPAR